MDEQPSQLRGPVGIRASREFSGSRAYLRRKPRTGLKNFRDHPQNSSFRPRCGLGLAVEPQLLIGNIFPARVGEIKMFLAPLAKETRGFQKNDQVGKGSSYLRHENDTAKLICVDLDQPALRPEQEQKND